MKKLALVIYFFQFCNVFAQDNFKIQCNYSLDSGEQIIVLLTPFKNTPSGSAIKEFELVFRKESFKFSGKDFQLATMKWDDSNKLYLGALVENATHKVNFIHVGPANIRDYYSFLDIYKGLGGLKPGRYKPIGICNI